MPIGSGAQYAEASASQTRNLIDPAVPAWINAEEYSHPVVRARSSDPLATVSWRYASFAPWVDGSTSFRIPSDARPAVGVDAHLHVIEPTQTFVHETFEMSGTDTGWRALKYGRFALDGTGIGSRPGTNDGTRAYGGSSLGGLIRTWEVQEGRIRHALALALTNSQLRDGYVWPATTQDTGGSRYAGEVPMGSLVAIPPGVDVSALGLSPAGEAVARALQDYGAYVVDRSASFALYGEPSAEALLGPARADLAHIRSHLRVVTNNSASSVGGGGTPRVPLAPPHRVAADFG
jgi:hypothetical protein